MKTVPKCLCNVSMADVVDRIGEHVRAHGFDREVVHEACKTVTRIFALQEELVRLRQGETVVEAFGPALKPGVVEYGAEVISIYDAVRRSVHVLPTAKRAAAMKVQGQYLGHLRMLNREARAAVKNFARLDGVRVALAWAKFYRGLGPKPVTRERKYGQPTWKQKQAAIRKAKSRAVRKATPTVMDAKLVRGKWAVKVKSEGTAFAKKEGVRKGLALAKRLRSKEVRPAPKPTGRSRRAVSATRASR